MSTKHLAKGSECPPKQTGKLRLYSMLFCPFAQRARIVLIAKNVPHDIVNVDLKNKPEWLFTLHPEGKVPALDAGAKGVIIESLDIADWIDKEYPEPPLYPKDESLKKKDKELIELFGNIVIKPFYATYENKDKKSIGALMKPIIDGLKEFEKELASRGTTFFGGKAPGMLDYMIWPWCERVRSIPLINKGEFEFPKEEVPHLRIWKKEMPEVPGIKETVISPERHATFIQSHLDGKINYDV